MKRCAGCGIDKSLDDFSKAKRGKHGRAYYCRACAAAKRREYYARTANDTTRAQEAARMREYLKDPVRAAADRASSLAWAKANPKAVNARNTAWRRANPERCREIQARYRAANPDKGAAHVQRRRARKLAAPVNDFTAADWRDVIHDFNHACAYCLRRGVSLQQEHMTPLSRGGGHTRSNIVPACGSCNNRKGTKTLIESFQ